ncbi:50S ribosomal protein L19e [Candidatus Micrarchaeota archaeon]|nr:50S ribosomal protein L19e [Candidatus Micrarchaeota archaeon]
MTIATIRRLAADILHVGENRIRFSPDGLKDIEGAMTRSDVRGFIEKGLIKKLPVKGRASTRKRDRKGIAHRRGRIISEKDSWMQKVRSQRKFLKTIISEGSVKPDLKRSLYMKVKSGIFRNKKAFLLYLKDNSLIAKEYEPKKVVRSQQPQQKKVEKPQIAPAKIQSDRVSKPKAETVEKKR